MVDRFDSPFDQTLLASYVLGHRSRSLWLWHDLFWTQYFDFKNFTEVSEGENLENGVTSAIEELEWSLVTLSDHIHPNTYSELKRSCDFFSGIARRMIDEWNEGDRFDLYLISWGDGSGIPCTGKSEIIVGIGNDGLLHIRIFDSDGDPITDVSETILPADRMETISEFKQQIWQLLPPHVLTSSEKAWVIRGVRSIVGLPPGIIDRRMEMKSRGLPGKAEWSRLMWLADRSLLSSPALIRDCYLFGKELGKFDVDVWLSRIPQMPGELDELPSISAIFDDARRLPQEVVEHSSSLTLFLGQQSVWKNEGASAFFEQIMTLHEGRSYFPLVSGFLEIIDEEVQDALEDLADSLPVMETREPGEPVTHQGSLEGENHEAHHQMVSVSGNDTVNHLSDEVITPPHTCKHRLQETARSYKLIYMIPGSSPEMATILKSGKDRFRYLPVLLGNPGKEYTPYQLFKETFPKENAYDPRSEDITPEQREMDEKTGFARLRALDKKALIDTKQSIINQMDAIVVLHNKKDQEAADHKEFLQKHLEQCIDYMKKAIKIPGRWLKDFKVENIDEYDYFKQEFSKISFSDLRFIDNKHSPGSSMRNVVGNRIVGAIKAIARQAPTAAKHIDASIEHKNPDVSKIVYKPGEDSISWDVELLNSL